MTRQVTLVALYVQKPADLSDLIRECQRQISSQLGSDFQPYELSQIHATIFGLERTSDLAHFNLNFARYRNQQACMNFAGLLSWIRNESRFPFQVQIGGFQNRNYSFTSRGQTPYNRSFSIQGNKVVLMGWPLQSATSEIHLRQESQIDPSVLDKIRQTAQNWNILHAYHRELTDIDNDFYFRIGLIDTSSLNLQIKARVENNLRNFLSKIQPMIIEVTQSNLYIVSYEDETLPIISTQFWSVDDPNITPEFI